MTVEFSKRALRDLDDIWERIAADDVAAADRVEAELEATIELLGKQPGIGHTREDLAPPTYRFLAVYSYLIVHRITGRRVRIVRIVHGARDVRRMFRRP